MALKTETIEIIIPQLDLEIIENTRKLRMKHDPYLSQNALSLRLGVSEGFVGKVENPRLREKYNIRHLNNLPKALNQTDFENIFPKKPVEFDIVRVKYKLKIKAKSKRKADSEKEIDDSYEVLSITPLSEEEVGLWNKNKLKYLTEVEPD